MSARRAVRSGAAAAAPAWWAGGCLGGIVGAGDERTFVLQVLAGSTPPRVERLSSGQASRTALT